ncbi:MAG TPA: ABC transporter permease [Verrucomicrobiae bacterium]|nr:ABC transporter permease [Verrucomicrobiae bacterium]
MEASATTPAAAAAHVDEIVIEAGKTERQYWRDLWRFRELFAVLSWRDIAVRYKQTVIGVAWAILQPLLSMVIMTVVFGKVAGLPSEGNAPYAIMVFAGMLPWYFFANSLSNASMSLVNNANLISKIYFPRMIVPASAVITGFVDFLVSFGMMVALMIFYRFPPGWAMLTLPLFVVVAFFAAMGPGLLITALNVKYRDFRYVIPFIVQFGLYVSPVGFSSSLIREKFGERFGETAFMLYSLNPMVGVIDGFRWAILGGESTIYWPGFSVSLALVAILLWLGIWYFRRTERTFADVI